MPRKNKKPNGGNGNMSTFEGKVWMAKAEQTALIESGERLSADPDKMATIGRAVGEQVRLVRTDKRYKRIKDWALYTFYEEREETYEYNMRMGYDGRDRLGQTDTPIYVIADSQCVRHDLTEAEAENNGEFIECLDETSGTHTGLIVAAPHGGFIENYTDEEAERVYSQLSGQSKPVSAWRCKGFKPGGGAFARWHITSTEIHRNSFPYLDQVADRGFQYCVSFHGYSEADIAVGGGAPTALKEEVRDAIQQAVGTAYDVVVVDGGPYGGVSPDNLVNWLTANGEGGVQIEQPYSARSNYWTEIADAVAGVFAAKL